MNYGIYFFPGSKTRFTGVEKKIDDQIKEFARYYDMAKICVEKENCNLMESLIWRMPFGSWGAKYKEALCETDKKVDADKVAFIYLRKQLFDIRYLEFLKSLRRKFPNAKILLEIPTYPYHLELLQDRTMWPWFFKDSVYKNRVKQYVDRIVTFTKDDFILGIPTIKIKNGICLNDIEISTEYPPRNPDVINMLAVARFQKSHGYERVIKGLAEYYSNNPKRRVILHMVGDGAERRNYEELTSQLNLQGHVLFYGPKTKEELVAFYKEADLGLGGFGGYKRKIEISSGLKIREYLANGIPVVSGIFEDVFEDDNTPYFLRFPNDPSIVSIERIVDFYDTIYSRGSVDDIKTGIRDFAKKNISTTVTMTPIIDYLQKA